MNSLFPYTSEIHYLRHRIAAENVEFKHLRLAPRNTYPRTQLRQLELGLDFRKSRLRFLEAAERKFNANQPRVSAGNSDGGQWTDGGGGSPLTSENAKPRNIDFSGVRPTAETQRLPLNPAPYLKPRSRSGRGGAPAMGADALRQFLQTDPLISSFRGTTTEAVERYNWLLKNAPDNTVPALHFTPHEFRTGARPQT
ncbi:hypothetical protein [Phyllobacterium sp. SB3]|uniref:hypothetical protein n=1 Tax=Phyllobacterium sp. SB3 TaxID=3156073 RepID=UPI0032AEEA5D